MTIFCNNLKYLLILLVVSGVIMIGYSIRQLRPDIVKNSVTTSTNIIAAGAQLSWNDYCSASFDFCFQYPSGDGWEGWVGDDILLDNTMYDHLSLSHIQSGNGLQIRLTSGPGYDLGKYIERIVNSAQFDTLKRKKLPGSEGYILTSHDEFGNHFKTFLVTHNSRTYELVYEYRKEDRAELEVYEKILESINFR